MTLAFSEIEEIIGDTLPPSASKHREWWANQEGGSRAPYWQAAGFIVEAVDLRSKIVRFRRGAVDREAHAPSPPKIDKNEAERQALTADILTNAGFTKIGDWIVDGDTIALEGDIPITPGVYAHIVDGHTLYIVVASMGLKGRLHFYRKPGPTQRTSIRINGLIRDTLKKGRKVWVIAASPEAGSWNDLPVDIVTGLEAGLPPGHGQGVGHRLPGDPHPLDPQGRIIAQGWRP
ncbi:MAG: hypothetical protein KDI01_03670 [Halioglobus sp.]|nr:hypothetical protein [Halioglobus sp.]